MDDPSLPSTRVPDPRLDRVSLSPEEEIEFVNMRVREAGIDEELTMFHPDEHPKPPQPSEEAVTDRLGERVIDMQRDTPLVDVDFDLSAEDLCECDL